MSERKAPVIGREKSGRRGPTAIEEVQRIGRSRGFDVTAEDADFILWEHTGFPIFWPDSRIPGHWHLRRQVRAFFRRHGKVAPLPTASDEDRP